MQCSVRMLRSKNVSAVFCAVVFMVCLVRVACAAWWRFSRVSGLSCVVGVGVCEFGGDTFELGLGGGSVCGCGSGIVILDGLLGVFEVGLEVERKLDEFVNFRFCEWSWHDVDRCRTRMVGRSQ